MTDGRQLTVARSNFVRDQTTDTNFFYFNRLQGIRSKIVKRGLVLDIVQQVWPFEANINIKLEEGLK